MADTTFTVTYEGPAVASGAMDVNDLAPALLAIGDLCQEANRVLNGERTRALVQVRSEFHTGSFEVTLSLDLPTILDQARQMLFAVGIVGPMEMLTVLGFVGADAPGLFKVLKFLGGRPPKQVTESPDGSIILTNINNSSVTINKNVVRLADDYRVRSAAHRVVRPLESPGIDNFRVGPKPAPVEEVSKTDLPSFTPPELAMPDQEVARPLLDDSTEAVMSVVRVAFEDKYKWTLTDGTNTFNVTIDDADFRQKVDKGAVEFAAHDALRVKLRRTTRRGPSGRLLTEYAVTDVVEVIPGPRPRQLLLDTEKDKDK